MLAGRFSYLREEGLRSSELPAAIIATASALVVSRVTSLVTSKQQAERLRAELRAQFMAEEAIQKLLRRPSYKKRSFTQIQRRLRGFSDTELRQLLVRAGAVSFDGPDGSELWGLRSLNEGDL